MAGWGPQVLPPFPLAGAPFMEALLTCSGRPSQASFVLCPADTVADEDVPSLVDIFASVCSCFHTIMISVTVICIVADLSLFSSSFAPLVLLFLLASGYRR
eukprot:2891390-Rhodomonas_salina.5